MSDTSRWLDVEAAAKYVSMRETVFLRAVARKKLPEPSYSLGTRTPRWDREAIDARIVGASNASTVRSIVDGMAEKIASEGRKGRKAQAS